MAGLARREFARHVSISEGGNDMVDWLDPAEVRAE